MKKTCLTFGTILFGCVCFAKPYLVINEDNDHYFKFGAPTKEALESYIDGLTASGRVTHLVFCACGQRASFDSKAWEPVWKAMEERDASGKPYDNAWIRCTKALHDKGLDPYAIWIARCRKNGVSPWLSMRMNDAHGSTDITYWRNTTFWRTRRDLWRAPDAPNRKWNTGDYIFDFAHAEVRDYTFAMAEELLTRYEADGLELDFTRHHLFFRAGHEREGAHFMTELVRRISRVARGKGRKLAVRVPDTLLSCRAVGLDVLDWAKEGLVDAVSPGSKYWIMTYALPLREWTDAVAAVNPDVLVLPGTDKHIATEEYEGSEADAAAYRGWAANMYGEGAKGLYLFNAIYHPQTNPRDPKLLDKICCTDLLSPEALKCGSFRFIRAGRSFYPHDLAFDRDFEGPHVVMLPRQLPSFRTGKLVLGMKKGPYSLPTCRPRLNGFDAIGPSRKLLPSDASYHGVGPACSWTFPKEAFRGGTNVVTVTDCAIDHGVDGPKLSWCEIALDDGEGEWRPRERWRGFNLLGMFKKKIPEEASASDPNWTRTPGHFREEHFRWMKEWGFNFARLPLDYRIWVKDGDWNQIDEGALKPLDEGLAFGRKYGIHVQICLHRAPGYCINKPDEPKNLFSDPEALEVAKRHWKCLARRYRGFSNDELSFDVLNEPANFSEERISAVFSELVSAIREEDPKRFIVLNGWKCGRRPLEGLWDVPNVGQSMRGYDPRGLSHYKAEWWTPPPSETPVWPPAPEMSGRKWLLANVFNVWMDVIHRGEFVMANEFACYRLTPHKIALDWMEDYLRIWKEFGMGWAMWNLDGRFGILDSDRPDVEYEDFRGHKLDRAMLELLRRY